MKKSIAIILIIISFFAGFFIRDYVKKDNAGLTKVQLEKMTNKKISDEEWKEMTKDGEVEMIGGLDGPTSIYIDSNKK